MHQIKAEAFAHSQVMETLSYLTDRYGPRLTGSPQFQEAAEWTMERMKSYGLTSVHSEKWGPFGLGWSLQSFQLEMTAPRFSHLVAVPLAWSSSLPTTETADLLFAPFHANGYDIGKNKELFTKYADQWRGKLKGKIVLVSEGKAPKLTDRPLFRRYTDAELADLAKSPEPAVRRDTPVEKLDWPSDLDDQVRYFSSLSPKSQDAFIDQYLAFNDLQGDFFKREGVAMVLRADERAHNGLLFAEQAGSPKRQNAPTFVVTVEQYSRIVRLLEMKETVKIRAGLTASFSPDMVDGRNLVGEIPGSAKPDEVVMVGAHFDSWHSGTGATDNGAGSAVMMEVMRILAKLHPKMDRTVRIALWSGEEQGLFGSKAYVNEHFGDLRNPKPEAAKLDVYLNLDNGSGRIRGVYLEDNDAARPIFENLLAPFRDLGVSTVTLKHTGGTDHLSFDAVNLPGFQFIQDPLDYGTVTHHSDVDTFTHAVPEDLMQASAVIATLAYEFANQVQPIPRKFLP